MVCFAKALEVHDLPLTQEPDCVVHIRVIAETQDVVIGESGLLLWCDLVRTTYLLSKSIRKGRKARGGF